MEQCWESMLSIAIPLTVMNLMGVSLVFMLDRYFFQRDSQTINLVVNLGNKKENDSQESDSESLVSDSDVEELQDVIQKFSHIVVTMKPELPLLEDLTNNSIDQIVGCLKNAVFECELSNEERTRFLITLNLLSKQINGENVSCLLENGSLKSELVLIFKKISDKLPFFQKISYNSLFLLLCYVENAVLISDNIDNDQRENFTTILSNFSLLVTRYGLCASNSSENDDLSEEGEDMTELENENSENETDEEMPELENENSENETDEEMPELENETAEDMTENLENRPDDNMQDIDESDMPKDETMSEDESDEVIPDHIMQKYYNLIIPGMSDQMQEISDDESDYCVEEQHVGDYVINNSDTELLKWDGNIKQSSEKEEMHV